MVFILSSLVRYLNFCSDIFGHVEKQFIKNAKVNFKIYDVIYWEANNYNTHIAQYFKK